jgi:transcriptional regulator with XRE-family HTH domain
MNEKQLNANLRRLANEGSHVVDITDELVDSFLKRELNPPSVEIKDRLVSKLRIQLQDAAIDKARRAVGVKVIPFGRFIESVREKAELTRRDIAGRLGKHEQFVQRVERGDMSPIDIPPTDFADLVVLFQIKVRDVAQLVSASLEIASAKQGFKTAAARSHGGIRHDQRSEDVERAMDALAARLKQKGKLQKSGQSNKVEALIALLEKEIGARRRTDLLT